MPNCDGFSLPVTWSPQMDRKPRSASPVCRGFFLSGAESFPQKIRGAASAPYGLSVSPDPEDRANHSDSLIRFLKCANKKPAPLLVNQRHKLYGLCTLFVAVEFVMSRTDLMASAYAKLAEVASLLTEAGEERLAIDAMDLAVWVEFSAPPANG